MSSFATNLRLLNKIDGVFPSLTDDYALLMLVHAFRAPLSITPSSYPLRHLVAS